MLGLVLLALGTGVSVLSWRLSVYLLLAYLPFAGIAIVATYPETQFANVAKDLAFVLPAYLGFLLIESGRRWLFPGLPLVPAAVLSAIVVLECFNPHVPNWLVALIGLKVWLLYIPLLVLGYRLVQTPSDLKHLFATLLVIAAIPVLVGLVEAVVVDVLGEPQMVFQLYGRAASAATQNFAHFSYGARLIWRIPSTFSFVAQYFSFTSTLIVIGYGWWRLSRHRWLGFLPLALIFLAGLTSGERGALIMLPILIVMIVVLDGRAKIIAGVIGIVIVLLAGAITLLGSGAELLGLVFRIGLSELYDTTVVGFVETLKLGVLGHGTGTATGASRLAFPGTFVLPRFYLESWWLRTVYELGLPGLAAAIVLFGSLVISGWRAVTTIADREVRAVGAAILAFLIWNLVYDLKGGLMDLDPINVYFWLLAGLLLRLGSGLVGEGLHEMPSDQSGLVAESPKQAVVQLP